MITCWERADLLTLLCVAFSCVFFTFPYSALGRVWYWIVLILDHCLPLSFSDKHGGGGGGGEEFERNNFHVMI